jgi:pyridoxal phosphate enzyme (YggS family)
MISQKISKISAVIEETAASCGRNVAEIKLIGVTKTKPIEMIREAFEAGLMDVGENYVEDFSNKYQQYHPEGLNYHFIGRLPTKKVRKVVGKAQLIHSVGSIKLAKKINLVASEEEVCQDVLIQVNQGGELSKSGADSESLEDLVSEIMQLSNIRVCGLMSIPPFHEPARPYFSELRNLRGTLQENLSVDLPYLSMGMSGDFVDAILEGSTHIRVGTSIFGQR